MQDRPINRLHQSGWFAISIALAVVAMVLFVFGIIGQVKYNALLIQTFDITYTNNTVIEKDFLSANYRTFYSFCMVCFIIIGIGVLFICFGSPWLHKSSKYALRLKKIRAVCHYTFCIIITLVMFFPLYWLVVCSLTPSSELFQQIPSLLPRTLYFQNYANVLRYAPMGKYFFNTIITTFFMMAGELCLGVLAAYGFSKGEFKYKNAFFIFTLGTMMIPRQIIFVPTYLIVTHLNWLNTFPGLIVPNLVSAFFIFLLRQAFMEVDNSYIDTAKMDGIGRIRSIFSIMIPMCKPAVVTVAVFSFINGWNSYFWPKMITTNEKRRTLALGIQYLRRTFSGIEVFHYSEIFAGAVLGILPVIVVFIIFRRYIITDMADITCR